MNLKVLIKENFLTTKSLILTPQKEWEYIVKDNYNYSRIVYSYFIPGLILIFLANVFGQLLWTEHDLLLWDVILLNSLRMPLVYGLSLHTTIRAAEQLLKNYTIKSNRKSTTTLFIYSFTPFLIASILVGLIPGFEVLWTLGFYSFRLLLVGFPNYYALEKQQSNSFFMLSILIWLSSFILFNFLLGRLVTMCL